MYARARALAERERERERERETHTHTHMIESPDVCCKAPLPNGGGVH